MEFKLFENKSYYLEYLQIFVFSKIFGEGKGEFELEDYFEFELTDVLIKSYNKWIGDGTPGKYRLDAWFTTNDGKVNEFKTNFGRKYMPKVAIWSDRKKTSYYKEKLQDAFQFENYIAFLIRDRYGVDIGQYLTPMGQYELGENALGIEIKNDTLIKKYGNVYIEYEEKSSAENHDFVSSGILKTDKSKFFLTGTKDDFYIFRKTRLVEVLYEELHNLTTNQSSDKGIVFKQIATSRGYVYPIKYAIKDTISMDEMMKEILADLDN